MNAPKQIVKNKRVRKPHRVIRSMAEYLAARPDGRPFIYDDGRIKSMHFNALAIQSSMRKNAPFDLDLGYTRTMTGFLLLNPDPKNILIIGLGGGSLSKFCYCHLPGADITTVEIDEEVISLREEFLIPPDGRRFKVIHADGAEYIAGQNERFDLILVDGYDARGMSRRLSSGKFYALCYQAIRGTGLLVVNLLKSPSQMDIYMDRLGKAFGKIVCKVKAESDDNYIGFAQKGGYVPRAAELRVRSLDLQKKLKINFPLIASRLRASLRKRRLSSI